MRRLRIAAPVQLRLTLRDDTCAGRWEELPELTRAEVLGQLARLIAKDVLEAEDDNA